MSQEDPRLGMNSLAGMPLGNALSTTVQVLPGGNVSSQTDTSLGTANVSPTTRTQWVKSSVGSTLWSGPDDDASAFTNVPVDSYFRVTGPQQGDRLQVYYVGDGLLRMPGDGWVDAADVDTVEAPAPGQVSAVDADAQAALPLWVQAYRSTSLWSGPDDQGVQLTDLPQWSYLKVAGIQRNGRILVNYAGDYSTRQPGVGWVDQG
ncbi:MAG TPA: hypothetical protein VGK33_02350, partial [Chloroflexota bacterium]